MSTPSALKAWALAARPKTLAAGVVPVLVGTAVAWREGSVHWGAATAAAVCSILIQIATNLANDYFDAKKGADTEDRLGPERAVQKGWISPGAMLVGTAIALVLAFLLGLYLIALGGPVIAVIGVVSLVAAVAYTGGPYPLAYVGLGDLFVFLFFGLAAVVGTTWVQTLSAPPAAWIGGPPQDARDRHTRGQQPPRSHHGCGRRQAHPRGSLRTKIRPCRACIHDPHALPSGRCGIHRGARPDGLGGLQSPLPTPGHSRDSCCHHQRRTRPKSSPRWGGAAGGLLWPRTGRRECPVIQVFPFELALKKPFVTAKGTTTHRRGVLVRNTVGDFMGWGEGTPMPGLSRVTPEDLYDELRPLHGMEGVCLDDLQSVQHYVDARVSSAPAKHALSAAILDTMAQHRGVSLARLLHTEVRRDVPISHLYEDDDRLFHATMLGTQTVKIKVGIAR